MDFLALTALEYIAGLQRAFGAYKCKRHVDKFSFEKNLLLILKIGLLYYRDVGN